MIFNFSPKFLCSSRIGRQRSRGSPLGRCSRAPGAAAHLPAHIRLVTTHFVTTLSANTIGDLHNPCLPERVSLGKKSGPIAPQSLGRFPWEMSEGLLAVDHLPQH